MNIPPVFIVYLTLFRLSIIFAGIVSIVIGYKLFCKGIWPENGKGGTEMGGEIGGFGFKMKNAAPGSCFGMFGVIIISVMLIKSPPELTYKMLEKPAAPGQVAGEKHDPGGAKTIEHDITVKGGVSGEISELTKRAQEFENKKQTESAIDAYKAALRVMAMPMNNLAFLYFKQSKFDEALSLSRQAAALSPGNANYLDTLAEILFAKKDREAITHMEKAAKLNPELKPKLEKFRNDLE
jgi:hypothetical protein